MSSSVSAITLIRDDISVKGKVSFYRRSASAADDNDAIKVLRA
jgi:hypothetical protein